MHGQCHCTLAVLQLNSEAKLAKKELKKAQTIMQLDELKCRMRVLRRYCVLPTSWERCISSCVTTFVLPIKTFIFTRLGYANPSDVIELKGRVACEISRWATLSPL